MWWRVFVIGIIGRTSLSTSRSPLGFLEMRSSSSDPWPMALQHIGDDLAVWRLSDACTQSIRFAIDREREKSTTRANNHRCQARNRVTSAIAGAAGNRDRTAVLAPPAADSSSKDP